MNDVCASSVPWLAVTRFAGRLWCLRAGLHGRCTQAGQRRCDQDDEDSDHLGPDVDGHGDEQDERRDDEPAAVPLDRSRGARETPCASSSSSSRAASGSGIARQGRVQCGIGFRVRQPIDCLPRP
jgi:hypothetical protein